MGVACCSLIGRYGLDGQLVMQRLDTRGLAVTSVRLASSTKESLTLTSLLYIGGLPSGYATVSAWGPDLRLCHCRCMGA